MKVLVFGAWDDGPGYPRTRSLLQALSAAGTDPVVWRLPAPYAGQRRISVARRPWLWPGAACRLLGFRRRVRAQFAAAQRSVRPDVVVVPYPGHVVAPIVRAAFTGKIVLDLFLSAHDTVVEDRRFFRPGSWPARALRALDRRACAAADLVLLDTPAHVERVARECALPAERFGWLPVGDPDAPPAALPYRAPSPGTVLRILFFGTGVPLHGLPFLVQAAQQASGAVHLTVIGGSRAERDAIAQMRSPHVELGPVFVRRERLDAEIARAHVIAGVFGTSGKADRVIPFKVVHGLAAGRPVLTGDTCAVRAWLVPGQDVMTAPVGDAGALAECLRALAGRPQMLPGLAAGARAAYDRRFAPRALAAQLEILLAGLASASPGADAESSRVAAHV